MGKIQEIRAAIKSCFEANNSPLTKAQVLAWVGTNRPDLEFNSNTFSTQLYRSCANVNHTPKTSAPQILWYERKKRAYRLRLPIDRVDETPSTFQSALSSVSEFHPDPAFVLEAHLQAYLVRNLGILENGLKLWSDTPPSVEFDIGGRRIDILAKDLGGNPVIIELKVSRGHEKTIGQALYYRGKLRTPLNARKVRIVMVAGEISDELRLASSEIDDVMLFEYAISMGVNKIA